MKTFLNRWNNAKAAGPIGATGATGVPGAVGVTSAPVSFAVTEDAQKSDVTVHFRWTEDGKLVMSKTRANPFDADDETIHEGSYEALEELQEHLEKLRLESLNIGGQPYYRPPLHTPPGPTGAMGTTGPAGGVTGATGPSSAPWHSGGVRQEPCYMVNRHPPHIFKNAQGQDARCPGRIV